MSAPNPELMRSLGRLARGLSALFWGLPAALIACVMIIRSDYLRWSGLFPALAAISLWSFGLWQMSAFQKQERPWRSALDRARLLALVNLGFCPFLFWWNRFPGDPYFTAGVQVMAFSGVLFLFYLNQVISQLGAMLPDETLRQETRSFTVMNRGLLVVLVLAVGLHFLFKVPEPRFPAALITALSAIERFHLRFWLLVFLFLLPLAMTMALLWKTKEVILESVFSGGERPPVA
jgi:hypothetical protein